MKASITVAFLLATFSLFGQVEQSTPAPSWVIKWSPLHLLNYYPTLQLGIEKKIGARYSIQVDGGWVISNLGDNIFTSAYDKRGFKLKAEPRYYFFSTANNRMNFFAAPEFYVNRVDYKRQETYGKNCLEFGVCDYYQSETIRMRYRESGVNFKVGVANRLAKRMYIEYFIGIAYRNIRYQQLDFPDGTRFIEEDAVVLDFHREPTEENRVILRPTTSFRIGYTF